MIYTPTEGVVPRPLQEGNNPRSALFDITQAVQSVQWGTLLTGGLQAGESRLDTTYIFTRTTEDTTTVAEDTRGKAFFFPGHDPADPSTPGHAIPNDFPFIRTQSLSYQERTIESLQFSGKLVAPFERFGILLPPELTATVATSQADSNTPDERQLGSVWFPGDGTTAPQYSSFQPAQNINFGNLQRTFLRVEEESEQFRIDLKMPFEQWTGDEGYIKAGYFEDEVTRSFDQEAFTNAMGSLAPSGLRFDQFRSDTFPFENQPITESQQDIDYAGSQRIRAYYLMGELPLLSSLTVWGGVRWEESDVSVTLDPEAGALRAPPLGGSSNALLDFRTPGVADASRSRLDPLPAVGFAYNPIPELKLRGSYAETLARQTFRELSSALQFEFLGGPVFIGNPDLTVAEIQNYDLRADYTPYAGGLVSVSWFAKELKNPIETLNRQVGALAFTTAVNSPDGELTGVELETRHDLGQVYEPLTGLSLGANATFLNARVTATDGEIERLEALPGAEVVRRRDATGTPEFLYNLYLTYDYQPAQTRLSLFYTVEGETLLAGGGRPRSTDSEIFPSIYQSEIETLNFTWQQGIGRWLNFRFQARNLTNPGIQEVYRGFGLTEDVRRSYFTRGIDFSFSLGGSINF